MLCRTRDSNTSSQKPVKTFCNWLKTESADSLESCHQHTRNLPKEIPVSWKGSWGIATRVHQHVHNHQQCFWTIQNRALPHLRNWYVLEPWFNHGKLMTFRVVRTHVYCDYFPKKTIDILNYLPPVPRTFKSSKSSMPTFPFPRMLTVKIKQTKFI